jgi:4,5-DOPA dioxygenase extradiol
LTAFEDNPYVHAWRELGQALPRPRAILVVSGHWFTDGTQVTSSARQRTIHDFYGFPEPLYRFHYDAPGDPQLADRVVELLQPVPVIKSERWGLDHGAWTVLMHMYPDADVPVVQLSMDRTKPPEWHFELGRRLAPLREEGVLVMGTGNIVHNLRLYDRTGTAPPNPMAEGFRKSVQQWLVDHDHDRLVRYADLGAPAKLAQPTPDHFLPLIYVAGLQQADEQPTFLTEVTEGGGVDMTTVVFGDLKAA